MSLTGEIGLDRDELERVVYEAFLAVLEEDEVIDVYVSRFPHEYGAVVLLRHEPSRQAEEVALEQEERFRSAGIHVGILVQKARGADEQSNREAGDMRSLC